MVFVSFFVEKIFSLDICFNFKSQIDKMFVFCGIFRKVMLNINYMLEFVFW